MTHQSITKLEPLSFSSLSYVSPHSSPYLEYSMKDVSVISSITSSIFIGSDNFTEEDLKKNNISHIINISCNEDIQYDRITSWFIYLPDGGYTYNERSIDDYFPLVNEFIQNVINNDGNVLVHCHMGISRSATLVIAYMIKTLNKSYEEVVKIVCDKRPVVDPCLVFVYKLMEYQKMLGINSYI